MVKWIKKKEEERYQLCCGNCIDVMKRLPDESIDSIVTDPPYHLQSIVKRFKKPGAKPAKSGGVFKRISKGFMGQTWDGGDISFNKEVWVECLRVLKPGGFLLSFGGTRTYHRMACAVEDAGFVIVDQIGWAYGQGYPKSKDIALLIDKSLGCSNRGRAIPTANSYQATKHKSKLTSNPKVSGPYTPRTEQGKVWEGWGTGLKPAWEPIVVAKKPFEGTIAANIQKYGTGGMNIKACRVGEEEITINTWDDGTKLFGGAGHSYTQRKQKGRWPTNFCHDGGDEVTKLLGDADRFFFCLKASKKDKGRTNPHPTVKPTELMRWLCRLVTQKNGIVLDPFMGSGTTGKAAILEGFRFIGIDLSMEYCETARKRLVEAVFIKGL